jgi:hypothetical protein
MSQSTQVRVEDAISALLSSISGLNIYTTNRVGSRLFPYVSVSCSINSQLISPYSGVYDLNVAVNYSDTSAKITQASFDSEYCAIFEAFYSETPTLTTKIQNVIVSTKVHMVRITSQTPTIRANKRAWQRGLTLNVIAVPQ